MIYVLSTPTGGINPWRRRTGFAASCLAMVMMALFSLLPAKPAAAADPAVVFMAQVGRELMAAARTRSPGVMANVITKYGDVRYIGDYSLGSYRGRLAEADREAYHNGMVRFISRYAASAAPKVNVVRVEWAPYSTRGSSGVNVDCTVTLGNGTSWDVRWVLRKVGSTFKVRDAEVLGINVASYLRTAFEDYLSQNGGHTRALVTVLNR